MRVLSALPLALLVAACGGRKPLASALLITVESVRAEQCSSFHGTRATTDTTPPEYGGNRAPAFPEELDDFAAVGVRFANAFAPSGSAFASLVALHTGRPPEEAGVYADFDRLEGVPTLAESLSLRGFRCGAFVARNALSAACGLGRGFETYWSGGRDEACIREARVWLESVRMVTPERPVFLWLHFADPRPPFDPIPELRRILAPTAPPELGSLASLERMARDPASVTLEERAAIDALHAAQVLAVANAALRLFYSAKGLLDGLRETLVVFAGTNGESMGERGPFGSRRELSDRTLHVPLFLWSPRILRYPRVAAPVVELMDVTRTIAEKLGCPPPEGCVGANLFSLLSDPKASDRVASASWEDRIFTVRSLTKRLVCNPLGLTPGGWPPGPVDSPREAFYDLIADPDERVNLAHAPSEALERMRATLARERAAIRSRPPNPETDAARLELLRAEGTSAGDAHPPGPPPAANCGGRP